MMVQNTVPLSGEGTDDPYQQLERVGELIAHVAGKAHGKQGRKPGATRSASRERLLLFPNGRNLLRPCLVLLALLSLIPGNGR
ncbi:MAG TPA: hypothetical protein VGF67_24500 [Ktedonobacteraceae bacterium]